LSDILDAAGADQKSLKEVQVYALVEFDHPTVIAPGSKILGSKLDTDIHTSSCRLAFEGQVLLHFNSEKYRTEVLPKLKVFKLKEKNGVIERANNEYELIGKNMFKKETNIRLFDGFTVKLSTGESGKLDGPFGQSGKFKVQLHGKPLRAVGLGISLSHFHSFYRDIITLTL
jgi:selenocysteine-specific elongation factor